MATKQQVKQALELALSLSKSLGALTPEEAGEFFEVLGEINKVFSKTVDPDAHSPKSDPELVAQSEHPVIKLLKKGKVTLKEGRRKQLIQIYDELQYNNIKFLSAKQNQHVTWFPLEMDGDKSAALFLGSSGEWVVEPLSVKANGELSGEWEGFDLTEFMAMNCLVFDQDDY